ncbi:Ribosome bioproteinsis protein nsa1 (NOP7-associated protein 1) [Saitoella coloradoensis]
MKVYTSDELGQLKAIEFTRGTITSDPDTPKPAINILIKPTKIPIQRLTTCTYNNAIDTPVIGLPGGIVQVIDKETAEILQEWKDPRVQDETDKCIGLAYAHGYIISCTSSGLFTARSLASSSTTTTLHTLPSPLSFLRTHPTEAGTIIFGGKDRDVEIWARPPTPTQEDVKNPFTGLKQVFKAKNVKNDELDLTVPIWPTDAVFLPITTPSSTTTDTATEPSGNGNNRYARTAPNANYKFITITRFRHIRLYDSSLARRPLWSHHLASTAHPLHSLTLLLPSNPDDDEPEPETVVFADTHSRVTQFSLSTRLETGSYLRPTGAPTSVACSGRIVAAVCLDRYLWVWDAATRELLAKVFLKVKPTAVVVVDDEDLGDGVKVESEDEDGEGEDVWEGLEEVKTESEGEEEGERVKRRRRV